MSGVGEGDDRDGREKERDRDAGEKDRKSDRSGRERERDKGEREGVTGKKRKKYKHKKIHGILSCCASMQLPKTLYSAHWPIIGEPCFSRMRIVAVSVRCKTNLLHD